MPLYKSRLVCQKPGGERRTKILPQKIEVDHIERCRICGCTAHLLRLDGWYYAQCYRNKLHRGQMFGTSMEALTDWNEFNEKK